MNIPVEWLAFTLLLSSGLYWVNKKFAILLLDYFSNIWQRSIAYFLASPVLTMLILCTVRFIVFGHTTGYDPIKFVQEESLSVYLLSSAIALVTGGGFYTFHALRAFKDAQINREKARSSLSEAKFLHLKNQIDPHFLFNSLNVLSSLIEEDAEKAFRYTNSLSTLYRSMLNQKDKNLVPLRDELVMAKEYLYLLNIRFEGALRYEIQPGVESLTSFVVPLCLQLVLENAVKHNEASDVRPLHINIHVEQGFLVIENNLQRRRSFVHSSKLGLSIIKERYQAVTSKSVVIAESDTTFRVELPLIPSP